MKAIVKLDHYYSPRALKTAIASFIEYYNTQRYHESLDNVVPVDVFFDRHHAILDRRTQLKQQTSQQRRHDYWQNRAIASKLSE